MSSGQTGTYVVHSRAGLTMGLPFAATGILPTEN